MKNPTPSPVDPCSSNTDSTPRSDALELDSARREVVASLKALNESSGSFVTAFRQLVEANEKLIALLDDPVS